MDSHAEDAILKNIWEGLNMFYYFIEEYRKIYQEKYAFSDLLKKLKLIEKVLIVLLVLLGAISIMSLKVENNIYRLTILLMFLILGIISYLSQKKWNKLNKTYLIEYKENKITPLTKLLEAKECQLDSIDGIEWLVAMCDRRLNESSLSAQLGKPFVNFFQKLLLPIIAFICGSVVTSVSIEEKIYLSVLLICILMIILGIWYMIYPVAISIIDKDKRMIEVLRNDLLYLKLSYK